MSKRRHRRREASGQVGNNNQMNPNRMNNGYNNPFGINPAQILNLFGGADMGQLGNLLSSMGRDGFDLSKFGEFGNMMQGMGGNSSRADVNGINNNQSMNSMPNVGDISGFESTQSKGMKFTSPYNDNNLDEAGKKHSSTESKYNKDIKDENIQFLKAIRIIADSSKIEFIDKIIEKYSEGLFDD